MISALQLSSLLITLFSESVAGLLAFRRQRPWSRTILVLAGANLLTHPLAWTFYNRALAIDLTWRWWFTEVAVVLIEAALFRIAFKISISRAACVSLVLNLTSVTTGWGIQWFQSFSWFFL